MGVLLKFVMGRTVDDAVEALELPEKFAEYGMQHAARERSGIAPLFDR